MAAAGAPAQVRVGVGCIVIDEALRVLVGRRKGSHGAGKLALPGGHLELGESWHACAARELLEETGVAVGDDLAHVATTNDIMVAEGKHYVTVFMLARLPAGAVVHNLEPHKNHGWEWLTWEQLSVMPRDGLFIPLANLVTSGFIPPQPPASVPARG